MPRPRRYFLDEAQIRRMAADEGMPDRAIADLYGCHPSVICMFRKAHGIGHKPLALTDQQVDQAITEWRAARKAKASDLIDAEPATFRETDAQAAAWSTRLQGARKH